MAQPYVVASEAAYSHISASDGSVSFVRLTNGRFVESWISGNNELFFQVLNPDFSDYGTVQTVRANVTGSDGTNTSALTAHVVALSTGGFTIEYGKDVSPSDGPPSLFIAGAIYNANGVATAAEVLPYPNAIQTGNVGALANGNTIFVERDFSSGQSFYEIVDSTGASVRSGDFIGHLSDSEQTPAAVGLANGDYVFLAYVQGTQSGFSHRVTVLDIFSGVDGTLSHQVAIGGYTDYPKVTQATATALPDGGFVVQYLSQPSALGASQRFVQAFNADGTARNSAFQAGTSTGSIFSAPQIAVLSDGSYVAVWSMSDTVGQLFNADGTTNGPTFGIAGPTYEGGSGYTTTVNSVVALANGQFVVNFYDGSTGQYSRIVYGTASQQVYATVPEFQSNRAALDAGPGGFIVRDTVGAVQRALDALAGDPQVTGLTFTDSGLPTLRITTAQLNADAALLAKITNTNYQIISSDAGGSHARVYGATGSTDIGYDAQNHQISQTVYDTAGTLRDQYTYDAAGRLTGVFHYDATSHLVSSQTYYAGSTQIRDKVNNNVTGTVANGQAYTSLHYTYAADGTLTGQTFTNGAGHVVETYVLNQTTGTKVTSFFDASGTPTSTTTGLASGAHDVLTYTASGSTDIGYDAQNHQIAQKIYNTAGVLTDDYEYDGAGHYTSIAHYNATGTLTSNSTFYAGTSNYLTIDNFGVTGQTYNAQHRVYDAGNVLATQTLDQNDGSFSKLGYGDNRTLTSTTNAADTLQATGASETFVFHANFGHDTVTSFIGAGATHDVVQFDAAAIPGADDTARANYVLAHSTAASATSVQITLDPANTITLKGVSLATLQANTQDFRFG